MLRLSNASFPLPLARQRSATVCGDGHRLVYCSLRSVAHWYIALSLAIATAMMHSE
jgi:hypothetical protein